MASGKWALPWGPVTWSRTPGRSGYPSWRHPTCRPRRHRHRAEGRTNGRNPGRIFSMGKWGTSITSWGFMGTPCFFKESHMWFRMLLIWSLFCRESFYIMWWVLKWFDVFHFVWMYFEHVWTCFAYFYFKKCVFICLQCLDVLKTIRLIAMGIGGQTWSFRGWNGDHRKKRDSKQQKQGSNLKKMTEHIGIQQVQNIGTWNMKIQED